MKFFIFIIALMLALPIGAQNKHKTIKTIKRTQKVGLYTEKFSVLASDTSVKHGPYALIYKNKTIEKGEYKKGERIGEWAFYNIHDVIEFKYNYDQRIPYQIMPHRGATYNAKTFPSLYLGSPMVPYHFIVQHAYYPVKESGNKEDCMVVLALEISETGKMTGYHLEVSSHDAFNEVVLNAAAQIPKTWRWVPARKNGRNVASIYRITLIFEAVD
ncbi:MAG: energy transducer TonB [Bacteroidales bacterium]|nr:energy transducer TonB [Bacteroidales bacterium]